MWQYTGQQRPDFALEPGPGQESVWDYPRPPVLVACDSIVEVSSGGARLAHSVNTLRVLETASPPTFYPSRVECLVDGERVLAQPGEFYGGWVTSRIVGPFKGEPGTGHW